LSARDRAGRSGDNPSREDLSRSVGLADRGRPSVAKLYARFLYLTCTYSHLSQAAKLFRHMQLFLEVLNDVLEFRQIFRGRLDQGLVSFQHRLRTCGAIFFQRYWKSLPVLVYGAHLHVEKLVQPQATQ